MKEIFHRTSIRRYLDKEIEEEKIERLLKAAMQAPSAANQQPWEFTVVTNKDVLKELAKVSPYAGMLEGAAAGIAVLARKDCRIPGYAYIDCSIASENLWLEADHLGLGAVMLGIAPIEERMQKAAEILQLPADLEVFALFALGYPAEERKQQDRYDPARVHYVR
ncbi:MAG: nitroreductase family protein [Erysipelotrichaceae bacterium]|nr:nitroreductase family protein [Erysipelotrichaceae bacterium]